MFENVECIDLSVAIDPNDFEPTPIKRVVIDHKEGADLLSLPLSAYQSKWRYYLARLKQKMGLSISHQDFPEKKGLSLMHYQITTHTGTHMDAPYHYSDLSDLGQPLPTIDQIPLNWCYGKGVMIDLSEEEWTPIVSLSEFQHTCERQAITFEPGNIVLINTGSDKLLGSVEYFTKYRGLHVDVVDYLVRNEVTTIGIDSFSFDPPFHYMLDEYKQTKQKSCLWPAHFYGRKYPYCQLERLTNLSKLKNHSAFWVSALPIKLMQADAAWCRVVAFVKSQKEKNK